MNVLEQALLLMGKRKRFAMATVIETSGSVPGRVGAKLIYTEEEKPLGSVGGGKIESEVLKMIPELLENNESRVLTYHLTKGSQGIGMNCGGTAKVFVEIVQPRPKLVVCGGGHIGYEVVQCAQHLDMEITIIEERKEFATEERFPHAAQRIMKPTYGEGLSDVEIDEQTYVVVVTKGSTTDEEVLETILGKPAAYIGLMGSQRKKIEIMKSLEEKGYQKNLLDQIYCPIGLDLQGGNPAEIALSIMAEVVSVKNKGKGISLKEGFSC
ncbi:protein of unknown function DUF182 [Alkaliphilus metalliredigens QYMF]|uniref:Xanthine dehydrogenase accessory factor n=1 Tax=Alkaliphilus metalliredigens (strain QYMF) TaxID=293826 RepID=A6TWR7_ALKMQ|nr:XdhC/CoxI family protein [Alkaliphilus metalliredigens]ABR50635.1 protein of unknown function DUF182 [Alkaliphilus metalliredigens QYMF]